MLFELSTFTSFKKHEKIDKNPKKVWAKLVFED